MISHAPPPIHKNPRRGLELAYQRVPGVIDTSVGYTQGKEDKPTYDYVCSGFSGHTEAVQVFYDPKEVSFGELCQVGVRGGLLGVCVNPPTGVYPFPSPSIHHLDRCCSAASTPR